MYEKASWHRVALPEGPAAGQCHRRGAPRGVHLKVLRAKTLSGQGIRSVLDGGGAARGRWKQTTLTDELTGMHGRRRPWTGGWTPLVGGGASLSPHHVPPHAYRTDVSSLARSPGLPDDLPPQRHSPGVYKISEPKGKRRGIPDYKPGLAEHGTRQQQVKREIRSPPRGRMAGTANCIDILIAIILPPLGVFLKYGCGHEFWICLLLTILGYIPGIIYAIYAITKY
nr:unnamed protein product [Digitaria exilis]